MNVTVQQHTVEEPDEDRHYISYEYMGLEEVLLYKQVAGIICLSYEFALVLVFLL